MLPTWLCDNISFIHVFHYEMHNRAGSCHILSCIAVGTFVFYGTCFVKWCRNIFLRELFHTCNVSKWKMKAVNIFGNILLLVQWNFDVKVVAVHAMHAQCSYCNSESTTTHVVKIHSRYVLLKILFTKKIRL